MHSRMLQDAKKNQDAIIVPIEEKRIREDLAKLGVLFINGGSWDGEQIVPAYWVNQSTSSYVFGLGDVGAFTDLAYGFLWWTGSAGSISSSRRFYERGPMRRVL